MTAVNLEPTRMTSSPAAHSFTWPILILALALAWRALSTVGTLVWIVARVAFWESVGRLQPPPLTRCVQCGTELRSRRPRCATCSPGS